GRSVEAKGFAPDRSCSTGAIWGEPFAAEWQVWLDLAHLDDDLADVLVRLHVAVRLGDLVEPERSRVDQRGELAPGEGGQHLARERRHQPPLLLDRAVAQS